MKQTGLLICYATVNLNPQINILLTLTHHCLPFCNVFRVIYLYHMLMSLYWLRVVSHIIRLKKRSILCHCMRGNFSYVLGFILFHDAL